MTTLSDYYTYAYLREDGTPYYIGKGRAKRIHKKHKGVGIPPRARRIFLKKNLTEDEAFRHEVYMIFVLGRKQDGSGILRNLTKGGEGVSGYTHTDFFKESMKGTNNPWYGKGSPMPEHSERMKGREWWHNPETRECSLCHSPPSNSWVRGRPLGFKEEASHRMKKAPTQRNKKWWYNVSTREEKLLTERPGEGWELGRPSHSEKLTGKTRNSR
jgi:hypothetical protein